LLKEWGFGVVGKIDEKWARGKFQA